MRERLISRGVNHLSLCLVMRGLAVVPPANGRLFAAQSVALLDVYTCYNSVLHGLFLVHTDLP